ncbi:MAG: hypothetical protein FJ086_14190 [Deltaproteobacteria bacterium]|nr:hypothetical protein [Deltaproteobacteria bacterium]
MESPSTVDVHAVQYASAWERSLPGVRAPVGMVASVAYRQSGHPAAAALGLAALGGTAVSLARTRRVLGRRTLSCSRGKVRLSPGDAVLEPVEAWYEEGGRFTVICSGCHSSLTVSPASAPALRSLLEASWGPGRTLVRLGTPRARWTAATVALLGMTTAAAGAWFNSPWMVGAGVACAVLGGATFLALSQRFRSPPRRPWDWLTRPVPAPPARAPRGPSGWGTPARCPRARPPP